MTTLEALTAAECAQRCGYVNRKTGEPQAATIRELTRAGRFPAPIDSELSVRRWRWSSVAVDAYRSGADWRAA